MLRCLAIVLLFLSAPLSGGLATAAQVHDAAAASIGEHRQAAMTAHHRHAPEKPSLSCEQAEHCKHPATAVHPFLCSACVAIGATPVGLTGAGSVSERLLPGPQHALQTLRLRPRSPPPKPPFSI